MNNSDPELYQNYLRDFGYLVKEMAFKAKQQ